MNILCFSRRVLGITDGIQHPGGVQWELLGTLVLAWLTVYLIIMKGLHASGKIVWFTALFPYFVIITLLFKAITLEGAGAGRMFTTATMFLHLTSYNSCLDTVKSGKSFKLEFSSVKGKLSFDSFRKINFKGWNTLYVSLCAFQPLYE